MSTAPLDGVKVVEIAALGPVPFAGMLLSDMGAEVIRIDRVGDPAPGAGASPGTDPRHRGRRSVGINLKDPAGVRLALDLIQDADVLMEGMRPGAAERIGIGPQVCLDRNPRLVYARMTGWGQTGPMAHTAGHDINYISIAGALYPMGPAADVPPVPLNLVGDFGGGALYLAFGIMCALWERARSGAGQVVDAAMMDGAISLTAMFHGMLAAGTWSAQRESNVLDGAAPYYRTYRTRDGGFMAVGAIEPQFYAEFLARLGLPADEWPQNDRERWPQQRQQLETIFLGGMRDEWAEIFAGSDACVTPVLEFGEVAGHPQVSERNGMIEVDGVWHPAPAPRFSRSATAQVAAPAAPRQHTDEILAGLGLSDVDIRRLRDDRVVG